MSMRWLVINSLGPIADISAYYLQSLFDDSGYIRALPFMASTCRGERCTSFRSNSDHLLSIVHLRVLK